MEFRVIWEIDIHADTPRQAAEEARAVQLAVNMSATIFEVWDHTRQRMHRVDLAALAGRLDKAEIASMRTAFRQLQCRLDLQPAVKDLLCVMLVFLDAEEGYARRH